MVMSGQELSVLFGMALFFAPFCCAGILAVVAIGYLIWRLFLRPPALPQWWRFEYAGDKGNAHEMTDQDRERYQEWRSEAYLIWCKQKDSLELRLEALADYERQHGKISEKRRQKWMALWGKPGKILEYWESGEPEPPTFLPYV